MKHIWILLKKDFLLEWRQKYSLYGLLLYLVSAVFTINMLQEKPEAETWSSLFWIILLFVSVNAVAKSFLQESKNRNIYYYTIHNPRDIIISKLITALFYSTVMVTLMMVLSLGLGVLIFGKGDMIILKDVVYIIDENTVPMRMFYAYLFSILGMATVASLAFMFSAFTQSNVTPIVMTMVVIVAFTILSALNIEFFNLIKKFFFTNYMNNWKHFFEDPFNKEKKLITEKGY